jgi:hypothetical protein
MKNNAADLSVITNAAEFSVSLGTAPMTLKCNAPAANAPSSRIQLSPNNNGINLCALGDASIATSGSSINIGADLVKMKGPGAAVPPYVSVDANKIIISGKTGQAGINITSTDVIVQGAGATFKLTAGGMVAVAGNMIQLG